MDDIWRNAELMKDAIRWVNKHKEGQEENIVVGYSMGGLISAIALRQMELASEAHQAWKYISLDAPHHGATVPLGFIAMLDHWSQDNMKKALKMVLEVADKKKPGANPKPSDLLPRLDSAVFALHKPATKQMLINNTEKYGNHHYHQFYECYYKLGLPQRTTNVAFSNGAMGGSPLYGQGETLLQLNDGTFSMGVLAIFKYRYLIHSVVSTINPIAAIGLNRGRYSIRFKMNLEIKSIGKRDGIPVYTSELMFRKKPLNHFTWGRWTTIFSNSYIPKNPIRAEGATGGCFKIPLDKLPTGDKLDANSPDTWLYRAFLANWSTRGEIKVNQLSFIPRNSALYLTDWTTGLRDKLDAEDLVQTKKTPFDRVYGILGNEAREHTDMTAHSVHFDSELKESSFPKEYRPLLEGPIAFKDSAVYRIQNPHPAFHYIFYDNGYISSEKKDAYSCTVVPSKDQNGNLRERNAWIYWEARPKSSLDKRSFRHKLAIYPSTPDPRDIEIKQLSMNFKLSDTHSESKLLPAVYVLWKGAGDVYAADFERLSPGGSGPITFSLHNGIRSYEEGGYIARPSPSSAGIALIGAYDVDSTDLSLRRNDRFMNPSAPNRGNYGPHTGLDVSTNNPEKPLPTPPLDSVSIERPIKLPSVKLSPEELPNVRSFYVFAPYYPLSGDNSAPNDSVLRLRMRLQNAAGWGEWSAFFDYRFTDLDVPSARPLIVPTFLADGHGLVSTSDLSAEARTFEGVKMQMEVWSGSSLALSREVMTSQTIDLTMLSSGTYSVVFVVGQERFTQTLIKP